MCLSSKTIFPRIALKDITCYKVLCKIDDSKYSYKSPFISGFKLNVENGTKINPTYGSFRFPRKKFNWHKTYDVSGGFIHTARKLTYAKSLVHSDDYHIFECIIPKGTLYYEDCYTGDYAAREIVVVKRIHYDYTKRIESEQSNAFFYTFNDYGFRQKKNEKGEQKCIKNSIF